MDKTSPKYVLKMLVAIVDRAKAKRLSEIFQKEGTHFQFMINGMGTASSEILDVFGIGRLEKAVVICLVPDVRLPDIIKAIDEEFRLDKRGSGIAFVLPLTGVSSPTYQAYEKELRHYKERWDQLMEKETERIQPELKHDLIIAIVNQGCSDELMDAAKQAGARGGTVVQAHKIGMEEAKKLFGISVHLERELVLIVTHRKEKKAIVDAIVSSCGFKTEARGIVFTLPVEDVIGLASVE